MTTDALLDQLRDQLREEGFCVVPGALSPDPLARARQALDRAVERSREQGVPTHTATMDPNAANVRVYNLPEHDPVFVELLRAPRAQEAIGWLLGSHVLVSNFTANIALPGSGSMRVHSDQALVIPEPWTAPWAMNIIWCLDDVRADNGATLYLPGSHRYQTFAEVPAEPLGLMKPMEAPAGSFIAMDGRLWHTSGANVTADQQRRQMFAYYSMDFIRQQMNWEAALSPGTKESLDDDARRMLGLSAMANTRIGSRLTALDRA